MADERRTFLARLNEEVGLTLAGPLYEGEEDIHPLFWISTWRLILIGVLLGLDLGIWIFF